MSKLIGILVLISILFLVGFVFFPNRLNSPKPSNNPSPKQSENSPSPNTDLQASFAIFTNGTFRVFTASMYHNLSEDAYIEASSPNMVKVKKLGTTWGDFFSTLPMNLTSECLITGTKQTFCNGTSGTLKFYLNGVKSDNALNQEIKDGDKLLVTFGSETETQINQQIERIP